MRYLDEFRDIALARELAARIHREITRPMRLMEVCGTHTMAIARCGIKRMLPQTIRLVSGPGCPVCVTPQEEIDRFLTLGEMEGTILATFGDMVRVPGSASSLEEQRARGADVRVVYSPFDAVALARERPGRRVIFFGVGFETTAPTIALAVRDAREQGLTNFYALCSLKVIPPALEALASDPEIAINGFLCPGHVSVVIGGDAYLGVARRGKIPCVISGFEPLDVLQSILMLGRQIMAGRADVEVQYTRAVTREGNTAARRCVEEIFEPADADWRGIGMIPGSGLRMRQNYRALDAAQFLPERGPAAPVPSICQCGLILKGVASPPDCPAFGAACTPDRPLGPCMVSSEGACAAEYRYGGEPGSVPTPRDHAAKEVRRG